MLQQILVQDFEDIEDVQFSYEKYLKSTKVMVAAHVKSMIDTISMKSGFKSTLKKQGEFLTNKGLQITGKQNLMLLGLVPTGCVHGCISAGQLARNLCVRCPLQSTASTVLQDLL